MHGPGIPPQHGHQPSTGGVVALRVLFTLLPILSCGFLVWGSMLRLALVTRKSRDWWLLAASAAAEVAWVALIGADPTPDTSGWQGNVGAFGTIGTGLAVCVYFLVCDIRHYEQVKAQAAPWYPAPPAPYAPPTRQTLGAAGSTQQTRPSYGYPPAAPDQPRGPLPQQPQPLPPVPGPVAPPRIGQVRAELDELSELLRRQTPPRNEGPNQ
ncbi:hypothetical protein ACFWBF_03580 [Streptomyces sp. NPDC060028]|uniref:hypothetical protein n=1 Tax=Streptomyces sp. NPDC060028 TaxID=3347041 RepID=UPI00369B151D